MARGVLRLLVESVTVKSNGDVPGDKNPEAKSEDKNNVLIATLRYPRSGAPSVVSALKVNLESGVSTTFDITNFWESGVFKEEVDGETILKVQVLDRDVTSRLTKFFALLFGTILKAGLGVVTGGISNAIVGAVASLPAEAFGATFEVEGERFYVVGEGEIALKADNIPPQITISLKAPADLIKEYWATKQGGDTKVVKKQKILLKQGDAAGTVRFQAQWEKL